MQHFSVKISENSGIGSYTIYQGTTIILQDTYTFNLYTASSNFNAAQFVVENPVGSNNKEIPNFGTISFTSISTNLGNLGSPSALYLGQIEGSPDQYANPSMLSGSSFSVTYAT